MRGGGGTRVGIGIEVKRVGGAGFILTNNEVDEAKLDCDAYMLLATAVTYDDAITILKYIKFVENPIATIIPAETLLHTKPAPFMATFTSIGPNAINPNILKVRN